MSLELRDHPVFICGHPKAGTSLVRALLDSHPQLVVYPEETIFFRRYLPRAEGLGLEEQLELAESLIINIFKWNMENPPPSQVGYPDRDYRDISFEEVRRIMRQLVKIEHRHPGDILSAAVLAYGQASEQNTAHTQYWVEKSPYNEYYGEQIFNWWPDAHCIHVLRDPRDNYLSYRRKHPDWSPEFFAANWNRSTQAGIKNQERFSPQRYYLLRFEDLTKFPTKMITELTDFLQIKWAKSLTAPTRAGDGWAGNSMFTEQFQGISAAPVERWKEQLDSGDAAVIEQMTKPYLEDFCYYEKSEIGHSLGEQLAARYRVTTWPIRRRFRRRQIRISPTE